MGNLRNTLVKALDSSETVIRYFCTYILVPILCGFFSSHVAWDSHYPCADPYKVHTKIQNVVVDLHDKYGHFTPVTFALNLCWMIEFQLGLKM